MPLNRLPAIVGRATGFGPRLAVADSLGEWTYDDLIARAARLGALLLDGRLDLGEARVALLVPPGAPYVAGQWGTWMAGGMSVPLSPEQTPHEWEHILDDSRATHIVAAPDHAEALAPLAAARRIRIISTAEGPPASPPRGAWPVLPSVAPERRALMLYTSGTTSRPKGVVLTHANLEAQVASLSEAWEWRQGDRALHVLPLNHTHGVINILACALWNGAVCEFAGGFDAHRTWQRLASGKGPSVFMAVPTIYSRLIAAWREAPEQVRAAWSRGAAGLRLYVSGSAALPVPVLEAWRAITGHTLLERYGMTEIGMALSNPLHGERRPGFVGTPLPGVQVRRVNEAGDDVAGEVPGELLVRGPGVFHEYWERRDATAAAFAEGGWFRTGDVATVEHGAFRILGRLSVDIIKTGGEKISALEVEAVLREHPDIADCAVLGLPDAEWGEAVAAIVVARGEAAVLLPQLRDWARARLSAPKLPRRLLTVAALPRNAMGKVVKAELRRLFGN